MRGAGAGAGLSFESTCDGRALVANHPTAARHNVHDPTRVVKHAQVGSVALLDPADRRQPEMIRHNFPTKALEYMVARRPILVHSPKGSYLTESARKHGYGLIVDTPDASALRNAVVRLLEDKALQRALVAKGVAFARSRDSRVWAQRFHAALAVS